MASTKEIRTRMKSVEQTLKITNAMYLIASSNLRKAKGQLQQAVPYFTKIYTTIADILHRSPQLSHHFLDARPEIPPDKRTVGYIVVSGDKGLAGAYNHNVLKLAEQRVRSGLNRIKDRAALAVVVANELFSDGIEYDKETADYLSCLARLNRAAAELADRVYEVVCGIPVRWKGEGE